MAEMVWAEMVMGRNGHGPKWLWAEMTRDQVNSYLFLVNSYLIFGQLVPTRVNSYLFWSTRTYFGQPVPVFGQLVPFIKKRLTGVPMDIRTNGRAYGIIYVVTDGPTDRQTGS